MLEHGAGQKIYLLSFLRDSLDLMGRAIKRYYQLRLLFSLGGFVKCCQLLNLVSKMGESLSSFV